MQVTGGRLSSVSLATPLDKAAQAVLRVGWQVTAADRTREEGITMTTRHPRQDMIVALPPTSPDDLDAEFLSLAWELGAWDVSRIEHLPLAPGADPTEPRHGITANLGMPYDIPGGSEGSALRDPDAWVRACARHGWITWSCRPMWMAPEVRQKAWLRKDSTLRPDGARPPRAWTARQPVVVSADHQTVIRLGDGK